MCTQMCVHGHSPLMIKSSSKVTITQSEFIMSFLQDPTNMGFLGPMPIPILGRKKIPMSNISADIL